MSIFNPDELKENMMNKVLRSFIIIGIALVCWGLLQTAVPQVVTGLQQDGNSPLETSYSTGTGQQTSDEDTNIVATNEVIDGNLMVIGSECVGTQCVANESFGFNTLKLKESNLRLSFEDTSSTSNFPSNDWRIIINGMDDGGANYFAIEDTTAGNVPFTVAAGAGQDALYVAANGRVGVGTAVPSTTLEVSGETGTTQMRIAENNASPESRTLLVLENNGAPQFQLIDSSSSDAWQIRMDDVGNLKLKNGQRCQPIT